MEFVRGLFLLFLTGRIMYNTDAVKTLFPKRKRKLMNDWN